MDFNAAIFDLDGTILDSRPITMFPEQTAFGVHQRFCVF